MRDLNEDTITHAVLAAIANTPDARTKQVSQALIRHLHAFVHEIEPTEEEWFAGIQFLTRTGHMCSASRQEFMLLSDTLGVSMLVDAINHRLPGATTETTVFGPFYVEPPAFELGEDMRGHLDGVPMRIEGTVSDDSGRPIAGAVVDIWHSDEDGFYDLQLLEERGSLAGRGRFTTDHEGRFHCWTARPSAYPIPYDGPVGEMLIAQERHPYRPEHVHFMIVAPGFRKLVTHIFAAGDGYLDSDVVFGVKQSLIKPFETHEGGEAPGRLIDGPWVSLKHDFVLARDGAA